MKAALITGFAGQDACYLADMLLAKGYKVYGTVNAAVDMDNVHYLDLFNKGLAIIQCDITDLSSVINAVTETNPNEFYNLAAQSSPAQSWKSKHITALTNGIGTLNCLEAIKLVDPTIRFFQAATAEIFGDSHVNGYQTETTPCIPRNPYGTSKLFAYNTVSNYRDYHKMFACNGILYNHESPLRGENFVTRKITLGVAKIVLGKQKKITLGDLNAERDWGFAGDYVEAMWLMLQAKTPNDYIIATGIKHTIADLCREAFKVVGILDWEKYVETDPQFQRGVEARTKADPSKILNDLNWKANTSFERLIEIMVMADIKRFSLNERK
jgi:GDPmannose 4,6-dehydratase